ncbi:hypothetical protein [Bacillus spizizenii]
MILHITESGYTILGAWSLFMAGVSAADVGTANQLFSAYPGIGHRWLNRCYSTEHLMRG